MDLHRLVPCLALTLTASLTAQNVQFQGLTNSPLGEAELSTGPQGRLAVDNLGSSGCDGVSIALGDSGGSSASVLLDLAPGECFFYESDFEVQGSATPATLRMEILADTQGTLRRPDFSDFGQETYGLRLYHQGELVYDEGDLSGPTRMQGNGLQNLPEKVYVFPASWVGGPNVPLSCEFDTGPVTPPGGPTIMADLLEFYAEPVSGLGAVSEMRLRARGPRSFEVGAEEIRQHGHFATSIDNAELIATGGRLLLDNLGSSGCDGVSIALPDGTDELDGELAELSSSQHPGGRVRLRCEDDGGLGGELLCTEMNGRWELFPHLSGFGGGAYDVEIHHEGQLVFSQSGNVGPNVSVLHLHQFTIHIFRDANGDPLWILICLSAQPHEVQLANGPGIIGDMVVLRIPITTAGQLERFQLQAALIAGELSLEDFHSSVEGAPLGLNYCEAVPNSTGAAGRIDAYGSDRATDNDLTLVASQLPTNQFGYFITSRNHASIAQPGGSAGVLCIGSGTGRFVQQIQNSGQAGSFSIQVDLTNMPTQPAQAVVAGDSWKFQAWHRDGQGSNFTDATAVTFR